MPHFVFFVYCVLLFFISWVLGHLRTLDHNAHVKLFPGFQTDFFQKMHQTREMLNMSDLEALTV